MKLRDNKGSITIFVLVGLLFITGFLIISFGDNINKSKGVKEQFNILTGVYSHGDTDADAYDRAYTALRKKNAQILTQSSKNSNKLELTKTFTDTLSDYKIYGNSVQNGTPTPDNPVEIQSVGDMKNLFKLSSNTVEIPSSLYASNLIINDASFISSVGTHTETNDSSPASWRNGFVRLYVPVKEGTFTLSAKYNVVEQGEISDMTNVSGQINLYQIANDGTMSHVKSFTIKLVNGNVTLTYTISNVTEISAFYFEYPLCGNTVKYYDIQIEEGEIATEYVEYGKYKIPVKVSGDGKNKLHPNAIEQRNNGITVTTNSDGTFTISGVATETKETILTLTGRASNGQYYKDFVRPVGKTMVTYCRNVETGEKLSFGVQWEGVDTGNAYWGTNPSGVEEPMYLCRIYLQQTINAGENPYAGTYRAQLEFGKTATEYEPYVEPEIVNIYLDEPLRKVGNHADYIDFASQKVFRVIGSEKVTSSSTLSLHKTFDDGTIGLRIEDFSIKASATDIMCLSNYYRGTTFDKYWNASNGTGICSCHSSENNLIYIYNGDLKTIEEYQTFINKCEENDNPITVNYVLSDPNLAGETIDLPELSTFEDYTKIEVLTSVVPSKIEATYYGYTME